jgi:hypothetical protein
VGETVVREGGEATGRETLRDCKMDFSAIERVAVDIYWMSSSRPNLPIRLHKC